MSAPATPPASVLTVAAAPGANYSAPAALWFTPPAVPWPPKQRYRPVFVEHLASDADRSLAACAPLRLPDAGERDAAHRAYPDVEVQLCEACRLRLVREDLPR